MADVFISYKKEDAGRVIRLVEALRGEGFSVWWDHGIAPGSQWDETIKSELDAAKVILSVWSKLSVNAPWVREEASIGKSTGRLLPVAIDDVAPPFGFTLIQAADLVNWSGDTKDPRWPSFLNSLRAVLSGKRLPGVDAPLRRRKKGPPWWAWALGVTGVIIIAFVLIAVSAYRDYQFRAEAVRDGRSYSVAVGSTEAPPPAAHATAPAAAPPAQEQALWDKAMASKTRQDFQSYLLAFPNGAYINRARDVLLTCRQETKEVWKPGPDVANQMVRGVGSVPNDAQTAALACAKAKSDVQKQARLMCETIATNGGYRSPKWVVTDKPCDCNKPNDMVTVCIADLPYSCRWENKVTELSEICGG